MPRIKRALLLTPLLTGILTSSCVSSRKVIPEIPEPTLDSCRLRQISVNGTQIFDENKDGKVDYMVERKEGHTVTVYRNRMSPEKIREYEMALEVSGRLALQEAQKEYAIQVKARDYRLQKQRGKR